MLKFTVSKQYVWIDVQYIYSYSRFFRVVSFTIFHDRKILNEKQSRPMETHSLRFRKNLTQYSFLNKNGKVHLYSCLNHHGANSSFWRKLPKFHRYFLVFIFPSYSFAVLTVWPPLFFDVAPRLINAVCTEMHGCGGCTRGALWQKRAGCPAIVRSAQFLGRLRLGFGQCLGQSFILLVIQVVEVAGWSCWLLPQNARIVSQQT